MEIVNKAPGWQRWEEEKINGEFQLLLILVRQ